MTGGCRKSFPRTTVIGPALVVHKLRLFALLADNSCFAEVREPLDVRTGTRRDRRRGTNVALGFAHQAGAMPTDCSRSRLPAAEQADMLRQLFEPIGCGLRTGDNRQGRDSKVRAQ